MFCCSGSRYIKMPRQNETDSIFLASHWSRTTLLCLLLRNILVLCWFMKRSKLKVYGVWLVKLVFGPVFSMCDSCWISFLSGAIIHDVARVLSSNYFFTVKMFARQLSLLRNRTKTNKIPQHSNVFFPDCISARRAHVWKCHSDTKITTNSICTTPELVHSKCLR